MMIMGIIFIFHPKEVTIEVSGRSPSDHKGGIPYRLTAEACIPSINVDDIGAIFEEHRICKSINLRSGHGHHLESGGIYSEEERKFVFNNILVGAKVKARFKIMNPKKVCNNFYRNNTFISVHSVR